MKAGMRSPGLYWMDLVSLDWWVVEQPRDKEREGVVVRVDGILWVACVPDRCCCGLG